ncbi:putative sodium-dependent excitatory amino acid transporter glt-6 [Haliotis asinina]|uniref:putative sodium-dependent excitatory amino acid transporter glt-6 n=1 Tax=Haliotis asinina TaxID=109174 RepID=UPI003531B519
MECRRLRTNALLVATIISVVLGGVVGFFCRQLNLTHETIQLIGFPGEIFMRMLKMLILPLIVASMVTGIANVDSKSTGKLGLLTMGYYIASTVIALLIGVLLVFTLRPGLTGSATSSVPPSTPTHSPSPGQVVLDLVRNMFPDNMVRAAFQSTRTVFQLRPRPTGISPSNKTLNTSTDLANNEEWVGTLTYQPGLNAIGGCLVDVGGT